MRGDHRRADGVGSERRGEGSELRGGDSEQRGVGGIFFDDFNELAPELNQAMMQSVGDQSRLSALPTTC